MLRDQCLPSSTELEVVHHFETLTHGSCDVCTLRDDLRVCVTQMSESPSNYEFQRQFLQALKPELSAWVHKLGLTAERSKLYKIMEVALAAEEAHAYQTKFSGQSKVQGQTSTPSTSSVSRGVDEPLHSGAIE